jgi:hypothetical protein
MRWLLVVALAAGCTQSLDADPRDLAVADLQEPDLAVADFAVADLVSGVDSASTFCAGTTVEGTCLQAFFAPLMACFDASGACRQQQVGGERSVCFDSGARKITDYGVGQHFTRYFASSGAQCFTWNDSSTTAENLFSAGGTQILFIAQTGEYTCGATSGTIGANCGGCAELCALLDENRSCADGTCP